MEGAVSKVSLQARQKKVHGGKAWRREVFALGNLPSALRSSHVQPRPPFRLPEFIEATGIAKIRQAAALLRG